MAKGLNRTVSSAELALPKGPIRGRASEGNNKAVQGEEWDSPRRTKLFLAAALLVGVGGTLYEGKLGIPDVPTWDVAPSVDVQSVPSDDSIARFIRKPGGAAADGASLNPPPTRAVPDAAEVEERLRDAVASFQSGGFDPSSAHSSAFAAAGGPHAAVPSASAAAAAPPAHSAGNSFEHAAGAGQSSASRSTAGSSVPGAKGVPVDPDSEAPGRVAVVTPRAAQARAQGVTPAERFFSGADLSGAVSVSQRDLSLEDDSPDAEHPKAKKAVRPKRPRRLRPALLSKLLGRRALKAPAALPFPKEKPWLRPIPPDAANPRPLPFPDAESVVPPPSCGRSGAHWHAPEAGSAVRWFHDGHDWGRSAPEGWAWLSKDHGHVWLWPQEKGRPLLLHQEHWWLRSRGLWFLLHDGEPWGAQYLREWGTEGFVHPSGAQMIYSADGTRVGMIEPDAGAILYDAQTGDALGRWPPESLPKRKGPRAPSSLPPLR